MIKESELYEEYNLAGPLAGWLIVLSVSFGILGLGMVLHMMVPDVPRTWDFGALPDTPAQSAYSTQEPRVWQMAPLEKDTVPRQMPPLPWAKEQKPLDPQGYEQTRRFYEYK